MPPLLLGLIFFYFISHFSTTGVFSGNIWDRAPTIFDRPIDKPFKIMARSSKPSNEVSNEILSSFTSENVTNNDTLIKSKEYYAQAFDNSSSSSKFQSDYVSSRSFQDMSLFSEQTSLKRPYKPLKTPPNIPLNPLISDISSLSLHAKPERQIIYADVNSYRRDPVRKPSSGTIFFVSFYNC